VLVVIRAVPQREHLHGYLARRVPDAVWCIDRAKDGRGNFVGAMRVQGDRDAVHLEDDVILTRDWQAKVAAAVAEAPGSVVQMFSRRKADLTTGSRWQAGRTFVNAQCWYLPGALAPAVVEHYGSWTMPGLLFDLGVADFLRERRLRYWLHAPSLVQHRTDEPSQVGHWQAASWSSPSFEDPWL
jgi:hypothetical protein